MLYGEGSKAFIRLQEEILKISTDHSIFAWEFSEGSPADGTLLAASPANFADCQRIVQWGKPGAFEMTNRGLRISLPTMTVVTYYTETLAILNCRFANDLSGTLTLRLRTYGGGEEYYAMLGDVPAQPRIVPRARRRPNSRLAFILEQDIPIGDAPTLRITREFEPEASKLKFWIPLTSSPFRVIEVHPEENWDTADGIMHAGDGERVRCGVTLETASGYRFAIAFGFDLAQEDPAHDSKKGHLPAIWGFPITAKQSLRDVVLRYRTGCEHDTVSCLSDGCRFMPSSNILHQPPRLEKIQSHIYKATMMQDIVFVVIVEIGQVFELQTAEPFTELEAVILPAGHAQVALNESSRLKVSTSSAIPPLLHLLEDWEKQAPCQVWMRFPPELSVTDTAPATARTLPYQVQFWPVTDQESVIGGIQFEFLGHDGIVVMFGARKEMDWKIMVTELSLDHTDLISLCRTLHKRIQKTKGTTSELDGRLHSYSTLAAAQFRLRANGAVLWAKLRRPDPGIYTIDVHLEYKDDEESVEGADKSADGEAEDEIRTYVAAAGNFAWNLPPEARDSSFQTNSV